MGSIPQRLQRLHTLGTWPVATAWYHAVSVSEQIQQQQQFSGRNLATKGKHGIAPLCKNQVIKRNMVMGRGCPGFWVWGPSTQARAQSVNRWLAGVLCHAMSSRRHRPAHTRQGHHSPPLEQFWTADILLSAVGRMGTLYEH